MAFWFTWKPPVKNSRKGVKVIKYIPMWCTCHCKLATASINLSRELPNRKKHILYIFVHFVHVHFGKNLVAMYINVVGPPPLWAENIFFDFRSSQLPFDIRFWTRGFPWKCDLRRQAYPLQLELESGSSRYRRYVSRMTWIENFLSQNFSKFFWKPLFSTIHARDLLPGNTSSQT